MTVSIMPLKQQHWPLFYQLRSNKKLHFYVTDSLDSEEQLAELFDECLNHAETFEQWQQLQQLGLIPMALFDALIPRQFVDFTIYENDKAVGMIAFKIIDPASRLVEVGYLIDGKHQGRGIATKALQQLLLLLKSFDVHKVMAHCYSDNLASLKVLANTGFSQEGYLKQHRFMHQQWFDDVIMGKLIN
ncbi:GNAT family N-acetyltransferase [Paraferrimonas sp. SM1919]|uniref:GNAT family N-acetyltransferase n=1 Tax=Paraferrimonas sp. SM1919 TaxID=2662263 RepID=UPI0013D55C8A|nr:GNAT family protein [Paraferrimonas sp. SM1919]